MIFAWLRRRRRRKILAQPFPAEWLEYLRHNVGHYEYLTEPEQAKLRDDLRIFVAEKNWEGCGGLQMNDEIKVTIAAQACLLVLAIGHDYYSRVKSILVYPSAYRAPSRVVRGGLVLEGTSDRAGEAWDAGVVVLAWDATFAGGKDLSDGRNLVFHEFTHQLDMLDRSSDGMPPLENREQYFEWQEVMATEYRKLVEQSLKGQSTLLDQYGATNEAEFFAVVTECFFEQPVAMLQKHPLLYEVLGRYYRQDPAQRLFKQRTQNRGS